MGFTLPFGDFPSVNGYVQWIQDIQLENNNFAALMLEMHPPHPSDDVFSNTPFLQGNYAGSDIVMQSGDRFVIEFGFIKVEPPSNVSADFQLMIGYPAGCMIEQNCSSWPVFSETNTANNGELFGQTFLIPPFLYGETIETIQLRVESKLFDLKNRPVWTVARLERP